MQDLILKAEYGGKAQGAAARPAVLDEEALAACCLMCQGGKKPCVSTSAFLLFAG